MISEIECEAHLYELLPQKCIDSCHCSGDNYEACKFWVRKLQLKLEREFCIGLLRQYGAWEQDELQEDGDEELNIKVLWVSASYSGDD